MWNVCSVGKRGTQGGRSPMENHDSEEACTGSARNGNPDPDSNPNGTNVKQVLSEKTGVASSNTLLVRFHGSDKILCDDMMRSDESLITPLISGIIRPWDYGCRAIFQGLRPPRTTHANLQQEPSRASTPLSLDPWMQSRALIPSALRNTQTASQTSARGGKRRAGSIGFRKLGPNLLNTY